MDSDRSQTFLIFPGITPNLVWLDFLCSFCFLISLFCPFYFSFSLVSYVSFFLSESDELELEHISDSEISINDELDVKELKDYDELRYFCCRDFLVLDLLLSWFALESFVSLGLSRILAFRERSLLNRRPDCLGFSLHSFLLAV